MPAAFGGPPRHSAGTPPTAERLKIQPRNTQLGPVQVVASACESPLG